MSYAIELIPNESFVYRQVFYLERKGPKKRKFPNEYHFQLREGETGLSVNWDKYIRIEENYYLLALTQNPISGKFQNHTAYKIFKYPVILFRSIENIEDVVHRPIFNGDPSEIGKPNNKSHSEVLYEYDMEILLKLSDYCNEYYDNAFCDFDVTSIEEKVIELKALLAQDNPYHRL